MTGSTRCVKYLGARRHSQLGKQLLQVRTTGVGRTLLVIVVVLAKKSRIFWLDSFIMVNSPLYGFAL